MCHLCVCVSMCMWVCVPWETTGIRSRELELLVVLSTWSGCWDLGWRQFLLCLSTAPLEISDLLLTCSTSYILHSTVHCLLFITSSFVTQIHCTTWKITQGKVNWPERMRGNNRIWPWAMSHEPMACSLSLRHLTNSILSYPLFYDLDAVK